MLLYGYCRLILIGVQLFLPIWCLSTIIYTLIEIGVYIFKIINVRRRSRKDSTRQLRLVRYQKRSKQEFAHNHSNYDYYYNHKERDRTRKRISREKDSIEPKTSKRQCRRSNSSSGSAFTPTNQLSVGLTSIPNSKLSPNIQKQTSCPESSNISTNIRSKRTKNNEIFSSYSSSIRIMEKIQLKSSINQSAKEKTTENAEKIFQSNSSMAIPRKGISYRRNLLIYTSLGTHTQTASIPAHLPTLEEHNKDKKLEEKRLEWLLSGVKQACKKKDCTKVNDSGIYCGRQLGMVQYQKTSKQEFAQNQKMGLNHSNYNDYYNQKQIDKKRKRT
ncbi:uncharacterized protein LOC111627715 [Centruroides sculpturatus]|uniref:uncharacterized protein LOC111627715 n=1 Tax=Centruroides sculpturatus TaxID=218467 RepID=UPI000C6E5A8B|nr:uncharacterized protein LOC111627715 [Centruroides sculpturatus]